MSALCLDNRVVVSELTCTVGLRSESVGLLLVYYVELTKSFLGEEPPSKDFNVQNARLG